MKNSNIEKFVKLEIKNKNKIKGGIIGILDMNEG